MANRENLLKKLIIIKDNPGMNIKLDESEMADVILLVINAVKDIEDAIKNGRLDGKTPEAGKDYMTSKQAKEMLLGEVNKLVSSKETEFGKLSTSLSKEVQSAIARLQKRVDSVKDGVVTEKEIQRAAEIALSLVELPDFDALIEERITANPMVIRDSLETIVKEEDKLEQTAIKNLKEDLMQLQEQIARIGENVRGGVGTSKNTIDFMIDKRIAEGTISGLNIETPSGTANGSNTDFTVSNTPKYVVVNTLTYFEGGGYSYSGGTITFDIPPVTGSTIRSIY